MDRLMSMRVFQRVIDEGSFAGAARGLDMSPAVVTRLVADLEEHLGARLLHRSTRKLALTDAGENYLRRVRAILQDIDEADALAGAQTQSLSGTLHLLCQPILASYILSPLVAPFRQRYPQIALDLSVESFGVPELESHDLALFATDSGFDGDIIARKIISTRGILVASPTYLRANGVPESPDGLHGHEILRLKSSNTRLKPWRLQRVSDSNHVVEVEAGAALCSNNVDTLLRAALEGAGISISSVDLVAPFLAKGQLTRVLPDWVTGQIDLLAALPSRKFLPQRTRLFVDFLVEHTRQIVGSADRLA